MMEIRFRAIHKSTKHWFEDSHIVYCDGEWFEDYKMFEGGWSMDLDQVAIMQYTGVKDKNGMDIYEGDIVACESYESQMIKHWSQGETSLDERDKYTIRFFEGRWMLMKGDRWVVVLNHHVMSKPEELEVVGNVHEHSHLLEDN